MNIDNLNIKELIELEELIQSRFDKISEENKSIRDLSIILLTHFFKSYSILNNNSILYLMDILLDLKKELNIREELFIDFIYLYFLEYKNYFGELDLSILNKEKIICFYKKINEHKDFSRKMFKFIFLKLKNGKSLEEIDFNEYKEFKKSFFDKIFELIDKSSH